MRTPSSKVEKIEAQKYIKYNGEGDRIMNITAIYVKSKAIYVKSKATAISARYGYWHATPEENAAIGIPLSF